MGYKAQLLNLPSEPRLLLILALMYSINSSAVCLSTHFSSSFRVALNLISISALNSYLIT